MFCKSGTQLVELDVCHARQLQIAHNSAAAGREGDNFHGEILIVFMDALFQHLLRSLSPQHLAEAS
jgi:hypothetical protein